MKNKITTSEGNICFQFPDGKEFNINPNRVAWEVNGDTINFIVVGLPVNSGHAIMSSRYQDLEFDGTTYGSMSALQEAVEEDMVKAGAIARYEVVTTLPTTGQSNTIYLVPKPDQQDGYDEYIYVDDEWELIGDTSIELENYLTKADAALLYVNQNRLGSAFTGVNSGVTITDAMDDIEADLDLMGGAIDQIVETMVTDSELDGRLGSAFTGANSGVTVTEVVDEKLDATAYTPTVVDSALDTGSTNAIQNAPVANAVNYISGQVGTKLDATAYTPTVVDSTLNSGSTNAIQNSAVATALGGVKIVKISTTDYEQLTVKDPDTLYVVYETNP